MATMKLTTALVFFWSMALAASQSAFCDDTLVEEDCEAWQSLFVHDTPTSVCKRSDPCACGGITCDTRVTNPCVQCFRGRITNINLNGSPSLGKNPGSLSTTIPSQLQNLQNLTQLSLNGCNFTGTIPAALGLMSSLITMDISYNQLTGSIPGSLALLSQLVVLSTEQNRLTGKVPKLPFSQYNGGSLYPGRHLCQMDNPDACTEPNCNHFSCPLPPRSDTCKASWGDGLHCK
jgi:hypothetical protein